MERLDLHINDLLGDHNGMDLKPKLDLQVFEDKETFDGAAPSTVREVFRDWVALASKTEPLSSPNAAWVNSPRYRYCLHVDQGALDSILDGPPAPDDAVGPGYVNLVYINPGTGDTTGVSADDDPHWMRIGYAMYPTWYNLLRPQGMWESEYRPPPYVGRP